MQQKALIIMNPVAGVKKPNKHLAEILSLFCENGYECHIQMTSPTESADKIVEKYAHGKDVIVCIGGDGTFNETVSGLVNAKLKPRLAYIPSGSTNDFATGLGISHTPVKAAKDIISGTTRELDVGIFNGRIFVYTASFGIFTKTSYNTPRDLKNSLGYLAYVLEGSKEILDMKPFHIKIKTEKQTTEGDYVYGGICNSKQIGGGIVRFEDGAIDMNDGLLEVILVKFPKNPAELVKLLGDLNVGNYRSNMFEFFSAKEIEISTEDEIDWTLDGEYQKGSDKITIRNLHSAISLVINDKKDKKLSEKGN